MCVRIHAGSTVESDAKKPVSLLVFATFVLVVAQAASADSDKATIEAFGIKRGEPINEGFFFRKGEYVEAPYIVERRGIDIYTNGHLIQPGPVWPRYDYRVSEDPGEPPSDISPFDPAPPNVDYRETYWPKKWRYLASHFPYEDAKQMMLETYRKCPVVERAYLSEDNGDRAVLLSTDGARKSVDLLYLPIFFELPWTKHEMLERRERKREFYESVLLSNVFLFDMAPDGPEVQFPTRRGVKVMRILLSPQTVEEKMAALGAPDICVPTNLRQRFVTEFRSSPQLKERVLKLEQELQIQQLQTDIMADARTATDAIADIGMARLSGQAPNAHDTNGTSDVGDEDTAGEAPPSQESSSSQDSSVGVLGNVKEWLLGHGTAVTGGFTVLALAVVVAWRMSRSRKSGRGNRASASK